MNKNLLHTVKNLKLTRFLLVLCFGIFKDEFTCIRKYLTDENYGEFLEGFSSFLVRNSLLLWMSLCCVNQNDISSQYLHSISTFICTCSSFHYVLFNVCHKNSVGGGLIFSKADRMMISKLSALVTRRWNYIGFYPDSRGTMHILVM